MFGFFFGENVCSEKTRQKQIKCGGKLTNINPYHKMNMECCLFRKENPSSCNGKGTSMEEYLNQPIWIMFRSCVFLAQTGLSAVIYIMLSTKFTPPCNERFILFYHHFKFHLSTTGSVVCAQQSFTGRRFTQCWSQAHGIMQGMGVTWSASYSTKCIRQEQCSANRIWPSQFTFQTY